MESLKKKRDPLCFVEIVDVSLGTDPMVIEEEVERAYSLIQDACEDGKYVPLSTQQSVHTYDKEMLNVAGSSVVEAHIVFVITAHVISHEELSRRQRLQQLGGPNGNPGR
jgi:hypothetical protein